VLIANESLMLDTTTAWPETPDAAWVENTIKNRWVPLDKLIRVPTPEEQARVLQNLFPAEMLMYAWEGCPQFITPELRAAAAAVDLSAAVHQPNNTVPTVTPMTTPPSFSNPAVPTPPAAAPWPVQGAQAGQFAMPTAMPPTMPTALPPTAPAAHPVALPPTMPTAMQPAAPAAAAPAMFTTPPMVHPVTTPSTTQPPAVDPAAAAAQHAASDFGVAAPAPAPMMPTVPAMPTAPVMPTAPAMVMPTAPAVPVYQPGQPTGLPAAPGAVAPTQPAALPQPPGLSNLAHLQNLAQQPKPPGT
jgi:hypothetical protein